MTTDAKKPVVIVTGASGLIGFALCELLAREYTVVAFDREGAPHPPESVEWETVDFGSDRSVRKAVEAVGRRQGRDIASVVHLAAYYDFAGGDSPLYEEITVNGTARLLDALRDFRLGQFLFSSTMLVHAPGGLGNRIDEDWPLQARWAYPGSKIRTEKLLREGHGDIPLVLMRIAGVYTDDCLSIPIARQIQRIYEKSFTSEVFPGDSACGQSFVHLDDLLDALMAAVRRRADLPREFPVLIGEPVTLGYEELQTDLGRLIHGRPWPTRRIPKAVAKAGAWMQDKTPFLHDPFIKPWMIDLADDHYALNIGRARAVLGWSPKRALRETLPLMTAALQKDAEGWYRRNELGPAPADAQVPAGEAG